MQRRWLACLLAPLLLATTACGTLSVQDETQLGHEAQRQIRDQFTLMRDRVVVNYVRDLGAKLVGAADPSPFDFRFYVVEDAELNAFAVPGGAIYVHTGLIQAVENTAELSGVIAHEIGHVTARHVAHLYRRQRNTSMVAQVFAIAAAILTGSNIGGQAGAFLGSVAGQAYLATFTQDAEREADRLGIRTLVSAGYEPGAMITMFETLKKQQGGMRMPKFLSSHPPTDERINKAQAEISALPAGQNLRLDDGGRLEIIQKRIQLIVGTDPGEVSDQKK